MCLLVVNGYDYIKHRLQRYDIPATVLLCELRAKGYTGGITILRDYVHTIKEKQISKLTERFETLPGQQAQIDWGECGTVMADGRHRKLYIFVLVLGSAACCLDDSRHPPGNTIF